MNPVRNRGRAALGTSMAQSKIIGVVKIGEDAEAFASYF